MTIDSVVDPDARAAYLRAGQELRYACAVRDRDPVLYELLGDLFTAQGAYAESCAAAGTTPREDLADWIPGFALNMVVWRDVGDAPCGRPAPGEAFGSGVVPAA